MLPRVIGSISPPSRFERGPLIEDVCEPNTEHYFGYEVAPLPHADKPDF
jgi:hypothetical protein